LVEAVSWRVVALRDRPEEVAVLWCELDVLTVLEASFNSVDVLGDDAAEVDVLAAALKSEPKWRRRRIEIERIAGVPTAGSLVAPENRFPPPISGETQSPIRTPSAARKAKSCCRFDHSARAGTITGG